MDATRVVIVGAPRKMALYSVVIALARHQIYIEISRLLFFILTPPRVIPELNKIYTGDCLEIMRGWPDKCVDLVVTDPPYGIGMAGNPVRQKHERQQWDNAPPTKPYFQEMFRVSSNQIIWGGNYFIDQLRPTKCFLVWNKFQPENFSLGMCEMAWTSFDSPAKLFNQSVGVEGNGLHPTQKPLNLIMWLINRYSKEGQIILDPFAGSGTTFLAAERTRWKWLGIEINPDYVKIAEERIARERAQLKLAF